MGILISKTSHRSEYLLYKYIFWLSLGVKQSYVLKYLITDRKGRNNVLKNFFHAYFFKKLLNLD